MEEKRQLFIKFEDIDNLEQTTDTISKMYEVILGYYSTVDTNDNFEDMVDFMYNYFRIIKHTLDALENEKDGNYPEI